MTAQAIRTVPAILTAIVVVVYALLACPVHAQENAAAWLQRIEDAERVPHSYSVMRQTITTSSGALRTVTFRSWTAQGGDVGLMTYLEPRRVAGDKILQFDGGDDIWYYMQRRDTTRHFAGHARRQSGMGSDFSYEDLAAGDFTDDYTGEVLGYEEIDGVRCVRLKCTPTDSGPSYDHIIIWAGEEDALSRRIAYYDEGNHLKTLDLTDFRQVEGRTTAFLLEMVNHRENSKTVLETVEITYAEEPGPSLFTMAALSRPIPPR
jgi:outer membrane lipoprotein-sorting protein